MIKTIDCKKTMDSVDVALSTVEIELQQAKREGTSIIKVLHGYGSHGKGGKILIELRKFLSMLKKQGKILDFFGGDEWNLFNKRTLFALQRDKSVSGDEDLNKSNPGITIIVLK